MRELRNNAMKYKKLIITSVFLFILFFSFEVWREQQGRADSIGIWYTIYCALIYTVPATIVAAILLKWQAKSG